MKAAAIVVTGLCAAGAALGAWLPLNGDVAWYVQAVRQWAGGDRLYVEIGDPNLPGIYLLHRLAYELASLAGPLGEGQRDVILFFALFGLLLLAVTLFAGRLLARVEGLPAAARWTLVLAFPVISSISAIGNFGEREHWFLVAFLPQVLCLYRLQIGQPAGRGAAAAAALLAAAFALLKPHFLIPYLLLELYVALRLRRPLAPLRAENLIAATAYLLAMAALALAFPSYLSEVLPWVRATYGAYSGGWGLGFGRADVYLPCLLAVALLAAAAAARQRPAAELTRILFVAALAFALLYLLQRRGWYYQFLPALAYSVLGGSLLFAVLFSRFRKRMPASGEGLAAGLAAAAGLLPALLLYLAAVDFSLYHKPRPATVQLTALLRGQQERSLLHLSTAMSPAIQAAVASHTTWVYSQPQLWRLPVHYQRRFNDGAAPPPRPPEEQSASEAAVFREVVASFVEERPKVVTVVASESPPALWGQEFDFLAYFGQDPGFAAAWQDYEPWGDIPGHKVFLRREGSSEGGG